jgi:hypothetical protein
MSVDYYAVLAAINTTVNASVAGTLGFTVAYDNSIPTAYNNSLWIRASVTLGETIQRSLGVNPRYRTVGILTLQVFGVLNKGQKATLVAATSCASLFRSTTIGDTVYNSPSVTVAGRNTKWHQVDVICPFNHDSFKN